VKVVAELIFGKHDVVIDEVVADVVGGDALFALG
jgi:hypothetical protein